MGDPSFPSPISVLERTRIPLDPVSPSRSFLERAHGWLAATGLAWIARGLARLEPRAKEWVMVKDFQMERADHAHWCWAAVAESVAKCFNGSSNCEQCKIANKVLTGYGDTCKGVPGVPGPGYDTSASLTDALNFVDCLSNRKDGKPHIDIVRQEIGAGKPVCVRVEWNQDEYSEEEPGAHFVVIVGIHPDNDLIFIRDPWNDDTKAPRSYAEFPQRYLEQGGKWTHTYYTRKGFKDCS